MKLIIIVGGTSAGKTTFSNLLKEGIGDEKVNLISLDNYYFPKTHFKDQNNINWDTVESYDWSRLEKDITSLKDGKEIMLKEFLYGINIYSKENITIKPKKFLIIEGIFASNVIKMNFKQVFVIFLDAKEEIRKQRRVLRDVQKITNFNTVKFDVEWNNIIEKNFIENIEPNKKSANLIIDTNDFDMMQNHINKIKNIIT